MSKVIVVKVPDDCPYIEGDMCWKTGEARRCYGKIPNWCPLRPLPEKRNTTSLIETKHEAEENRVTPQHQAGFNLGWNACLEAITGGNHE